MVDKTVVDDYYSNVGTSSWDPKKSWEKKAFKIKAKKVMKKVVKTDGFETEKKPQTKNNEDKTPKVVISTPQPKTWMKVIKQFSDWKKSQWTQASWKATEKKPFVKKWWYQWTKKTFSKGNNAPIKKTYLKPKPVWERKPFVKRWPWTGWSYAKPWTSSSQNSSYSSGPAKQEKVFSNNKKKWGGQKYNTPKNSALKPYNKGKKYTWKWGEPEEKVFSRAKKSTSAKIEKNVEDIKQNLVERKWQTVVVWDILSLKELSEKIGVNMVKLIAEFMKNGMMVNINSKIDFDSASIVAEVFDIKLKRDDSEWFKVEDLMIWNIADLLREDDWTTLEERPPVVSIMGHVDHWKTSLLDQIKTTWSNVTDGEAGWITQSIWAYQVVKDGKKITFLDTPGHEAFTVMRARWAKSTDIAILVVAADEWVKPQTIESVNHAKEAWIPVVVAINKMDKEWANPDHVKWQLAELWLSPEDWGGDTPMVPVSAHSGFGIDELLEIVLLVAEMKELKANPNRKGVATIIESHLDMRLWPVSTILVNTGTIQKWDYAVCNDSFWKIKVLKNFENKSIKKAIPWDPVLIVGLDKVVGWWDVLQIVNNASQAKEKALDYRDIILAKKKNEVSGLEVLMSRIKAWSLKQLKVVVKADSNWSLEALKVALTKLSTPETNVAVIHSGVGNITGSDVVMCSSSSAILIGFNVEVIPTAKQTLESEKVEFIESKIIYHITERIEKIVTGMLDPKEIEVVLGQAKVWGIFYTSKEFVVLGLILQPENNIESNTKVRVIRKKTKIGDWEIISLKSWVEEVKQLEGPCECWIKFKWTMQPEMWDYLEIYKTIIEK